MHDAIPSCTIGGAMRKYYESKYENEKGGGDFLSSTIL